MAKIAFIFPGQGSQAIGMGKELYQNFAESKAIFEQANNILDFDLQNLIFNGSKEELQKTENTQPALFTTSIAILKILQKENIKPIVLAGHSLGEFTAYTASESLTFQDGLITVRKRGELMANADPQNKGTMAAIIGLDDDIVEDICKQASTEGIIVPANYNSPGQLVISGEKKAIEKGVLLAKEYKARMAVILDVSGAFHSPLIEEASQKFHRFLKEISFEKPTIPVISNVTADIVDVNHIKNSLVKQMTSSVLWKKSVEKMIEMGVDTFIEIGAGKVLQGLVKKTNRAVTTLGINTVSTLEKSLEKLK